MSLASPPPSLHDEPDATYVAVMGPTGAGKTTLINLLSNSNLKIGSELQSCTDRVQLSLPFELDGHRIILIDTPGFDDTKLSDTAVLNMIGAFMSYAHRNGRRLGGVVYLHRILDNRMGGISTRNFRIFRKLCGDDSLQSVVIATTMWEGVDEQVGKSREEELATKDDFFKPALDKGAQLVRHANDLASAQAIVRLFLTSESPSVTLQIQSELENGIDIGETLVGKEVTKEIFEQLTRQREEIRGVMEEIQQAVRMRDEESRTELLQERTRLEGIVTRLQTETATMSAGYAEALRSLEERLKAAEASAARSAAAAAAAASARCHDAAGGKGPGGGSQYPGQQTHSPIVQAVAATENSNAILEGKLAAAVPVVGFWGRLAIMLAPFSLTWR